MLKYQQTRFGQENQSYSRFECEQNRGQWGEQSDRTKQHQRHRKNLNLA